MRQVLGGWLADRVGGKWLFGGGILGCAVLTFLTPTAARLHIAAVIVVRVLEGVCEGVVLPSTQALLACWTPSTHTTRGVTFVFSGQEVGYVVGMLLGGFLSDHGFAGGWPSVFYVSGTIGCVWAISWFLLCHSSPATHPRISKAERQRLEAVLSPSACGIVDRPGTPWRKILTSVPLLACCVGKFAHIWGYQTLVNGLPLFFYDVLGISMTRNGLLASLPYLAASTMMVTSGQIADWLRAPSRLSTTAVRKIFCVCGLVLPSFFFILAGYLGCDRWLVVLTMIAAMACQGCAWSCLSVNPLDLSMMNAATLFGITNTTATLASIATPQVIGTLTYHNPSLVQWRKIFYITVLVEWLGTVVFLLLGSGEPQQWNDDADEKST